MMADKTKRRSTFRGWSIYPSSSSPPSCYDRC
jgi:hypothetical protein